MAEEEGAEVVKKPIPRKAGLMNTFGKLPNEITTYFDHFTNLLDQFPPDVVISYMFAMVELAHNNTIYCGVVKMHKVDSTLARKAVDNHHMTRGDFKTLFKTILGKGLTAKTAEKIKSAEIIRDKILHGKSVNKELQRKAILEILEYAELFNEEVDNIAGIKPFGKLQGFKGAAKPLDKSTSRWILKGIGLTIS